MQLTLHNTKITPKNYKKTGHIERLFKGEFAEKIYNIVKSRKYKYNELTEKEKLELEYFPEKLYCADATIDSAFLYDPFLSSAEIMGVQTSSIITHVLGSRNVTTVGEGVNLWSPVQGTHAFYAKNFFDQNDVPERRPMYNPNDATLFGRGTVTGNGVTSRLVSSINLANVSYPVYIRCLLKYNRVTNQFAGEAPFSNGAQFGVTIFFRNPPQAGDFIGINMFPENIAYSGPSTAINVWYVLEAYFNLGTNVSYIKQDGYSAFGTFVNLPVTTVNLSLLATTTAGSYGLPSAASIAEFFCSRAEPSSYQKQLFDANHAYYYNNIVRLTS